MTRTGKSKLLTIVFFALIWILLWASAAIPAGNRAAAVEAAPTTPSPTTPPAMQGMVHYYLGNDPDRWQRNVPPDAQTDDLRFEIGSARQVSPESLQALSPVLLYSTYLGSRNHDQAMSLALDDAGNIYITGITHAADFEPVTTTIPIEEGNVFVAKLSPQGDLIYLTFLGGSAGEEGNGIDVDAQGNAYVTGRTVSLDFPMLNAWQPEFAGREDAYLFKLGPTGQLVYSTYIGGTTAEEANAVFADDYGNAYIGGEVYSDDYPLLNPWSDKTYGPNEEDCFISAFDVDGQLVYSTYVSAPMRDQVFRLTVDRQGYIYGTGMTSSDDFPTVNPFQSVYGGGWDDCFVFKLDPEHNQMIYSTYLGGADRDECWGIEVDSEGAAYVAGHTLSSNFPVVNPVQAEHQRDYDVFVAKLSPEGDQLLYSTYIGGNGLDWAEDISLDSGGNIYVTGGTQSTNFPFLNALQASLNGPADGFLIALAPDGSLQYSSAFGGADYDRGWGLAVDRNWFVNLTGSTDSPDLPLKNPLQDQKAGDADTFVARFGLFPTPTFTPSPTPTATPTPTSTPTPYASGKIGPEGGSIWMAYAEHLTMLTVPAGSLDREGTFTLVYANRSLNQGSLFGVGHFFTLSADVPGSTLWQPPRFANPLRLQLSYAPGPVPDESLQLYRMTPSGWTTAEITLQQHLPGYIVADIHQTGLYGLLGEPRRLYLPIVLRQHR
ncbi:MAG: SBBP repeat-containing protein [Anaerolineae bacterium]|nr:SBBP repeat-containing protein [Anaerolineae bacterium]